MDQEIIEGYRLSPQQQRLWLLQQHTSACPAQCAVLIDGPLKLERLRECLAQLVRRHDILHTAFQRLPGLDLPLQVIVQPYAPPVRVVDYSKLDDCDAALSLLYTGERASSFALEQGQMLHTVLVHLGADHRLLLLTVPALCADTASLVNLVSELSQSYQHKRVAGEVVQFVQFSEWQHELLESAEEVAGRKFWEREELPVAQLPGENNRLGSSAVYQPEVVTVKLETEAIRSLDVLAQRQSSTRAAVLLTCWGSLLWRLTGESQSCIEMAFNGRKYEELREAVGLFGQWLPLPSRLNEASTFSALLDETTVEINNAYAKQEFYVPRSTGAETPRSSIGYEYEEWPEEIRSGELNWRVRMVWSGVEWQKLRLSVVAQGEKLELNFHYDGQRFSSATVARLSGQYLTLLRAALAQPLRPLQELELLSGAERQQLLVEWQGPQTESTRSGCVHELFEAQAAQRPEQPAVIYEGQQLSYAELNRQANQLAHQLRGYGVGPEVRVGILLERSLEQVVAVLGILKAGGAYVPLEAATPAARVRVLLDDAAVAVLVTQREQLPKVPPLAGRVLVLAEEREQIRQQSVANPAPVAQAANLAYMIYTSGSTGHPKGVLIEHRMAVWLSEALAQTIYAEQGEWERVSLNAPLSFDASVKQLLQLGAGRTVCLVPEWVRRDGVELRAYLEREQVAVLDCTPSQWRMLRQAGSSGPGYWPRVVLLGGEAIGAELWRELSADRERSYYNLYGPTECTVDASWERVSEREREPGLGRGLPNTQLVILDQRQELAPAGVAGELCIGGAGVGRGYWRRAELTAEKFIADRFSGKTGARLYRTGDMGRYLADGRLEYLGRRDRQVKLRGYRVELGEIERVLGGHEGVRECAVVARAGEWGVERLVAYVVKGERGRVGAGRRYRLPNGLEIAHRNHNETAYLYEEIFAKGSYLRHGIRLPAGSCVFDVGANIGMFTLYVQQQCAGARVYAFEPLAELCATLRENGRLLGEGAVKVFGYGLGSAEQEVEFTYYERYTMMSGVSAYADAAAEVAVIKSYLRQEQARGESGAGALLAQAEELLAGRFEGRSEQCRLRRLSEVMREEAVTAIELLKVDVQRAELEVLRGIEEAEWGKIRQVVMEVHDVEGGAGRCAELRQLLEEHGYRVVIEQEELLAGTDRYNLYAVQEGWDGVAAGAGGESSAVGAVSGGAGELREYLQQRLPEYMLPSAYVELSRLPLTRHGKVDYAALPEPENVGEEEQKTEPRTPVEEMLAGIWQELLRVKAVGVDENFFELGGHSLLAMRLVSRIREVFKVEVSLRKLFEGPTITSLAAHVEQLLMRGDEIVAPPVTRVLREGPLPLSFAQQRLWFIDQLEPGSAMYNCPAAVRLSGELDVEALRRTLTEVVRRHEVLRTHFAEVDGEPVQLISAAAPLPLPVIDLSAWEERAREAEVRRLAQAEANTAFDLSSGPLLRVQLLRLGESEHVVLLTMHHIISDGWSIGVLIRELSALYKTFANGTAAELPELPIQYGDYAVWQRDWLQGEVLEEQLRYWRRQLGGELPVLELATDGPRPAVRSHRGAQQTFTVGRELTAGVRELSRREGVTLFMTLLAAFQTLLYRYTQQADILVGSVIAGRNPRETESLIGFFVNTLVLRTDLSGEPSVCELLKRVREVTLNAYAHQEVPFEKLVEELQPQRTLSHAPLFQVMLVLQNTGAEELALPRLAIRRLSDESETAKFDLTLTALERGEQLLLSWNYNTELFAEPSIERLSGHYERLLAGMVQAPEQRISELELLSEAEREQLLVQWNESDREVGEEQCLPELIEAQVRRSAQSVALVFGEEEVSYEELNCRANQLAHYLRRQGVGPEVLVGVLLERSVELVVAVLGVLKAGGAYVPLDPAYPPERLRFMLEDVLVLLTQERLVTALPETEAEIVCLDEDWEQIAEESVANPSPLTQPGNLAYVIYTSGSTGKPKGVQIQQRGLLNFLAAMGERLGFAATDVFLSVTSLSFDIAGLELFLPLITGARVVVASHEEVVDGGLLMARLETSGATVMQATPATWRLLLEAGWQGDKGLQVLCGGEAMGAKLAQQLAAGSRELWNLYGPTETTVWSTISKVESALPVSIGVPLANTQCYVLDRHWQPVPFGVAGELCLAGEGLARGYLQRPELTAEKFIANPFSSTAGARMYRTGDLVRYRRTGELEYLGRLDQQVKLRGYRIELGGIEAALLSHTAVSKCVVTAREESNGEKRLVAYVVLEPEALVEQWQRELRKHVRARLPEHMTPAVFVRLEALPLTANGKIDRRALPAPEVTEERRETETAVTAVEELLLGIWQEVLRVKVVGLGDNFFELGGHSLLGTRLLSRVRAAFGVELGLRKLFEAPTVAGLAAEVEQLLKQGAGVAAPPLRRALREGPLPLSFAQQRLWFIDQLEQGSAMYNCPAAVRLSGELDVEALRRTLTEVVRRHEVLRTHFAEVDGEPVQLISAAAPLPLPVTDLSAWEESAREAEVRRLAQAEANTAFDLSSGPLLRVQLLRLGDSEHVVLLTMHHIISDGWSIGVLIRELSALYKTFANGAAAELPELPIQYGDYAVWQRDWLQGEVLEEQLRYWRRQLGGELPVLELATDGPRPAVRRHRGAQQTFTVGSELTAGVKELSRREGVTLFMTLLAAFQTLLYRYTQQADILVGSVIAGRNRRETESLIGFFVNTLVLRTDLSGEPSVCELLSRVREVTLNAYAHQEVPFEKLVEELQPQRTLSHAPLFQVMLVLQNTGAEELALPRLAIRRLSDESETAKFDLTLTALERGEQLLLSWNYNTELFAETSIERLSGHYERLLAGMVQAPEQRISELELLSEAEREQLLVQWNQSDREVAAEQCLPELIEAQVRRSAQSVALVFGEEEVSYEELNCRANQLAHYLRRQRVGPEVLVGVLMERSVELVVAVLGVLKAGGAYVPLDPAYPPERLRFMFEDVPVLLTQERLVTALPETDAEIVCLDEDWEQIAEESVANPSPLTLPGNLAYVIYTSGSTGKPKGVQIQQRGLLNFLAAMGDCLSFTGNDVFLSVTSLSFDIAGLELFLPLITGARVVVASHEEVVDGGLLMARLETSGATVMQATPATWRLLLEAGWQGDKGLQVLCGGEAMGAKLAQQLAAGSRELWNLYGPTETTVWSTISRVESALPVSIGVPLANTQCYVLDRHWQPVPFGVAGELCLAGEGLARGYLQRPELTAEKFIANPFSSRLGARMYRTGDLVRYRRSGELEYLGRLDQQVKLRGYRIELGEIEAALLSHTAVSKCVVTAREESNGEKRLVAYVVLEPEALVEQWQRELRKHVRAGLPEHMTPAVFVRLEALPLTANGKLDRRALPAPDDISATRETAFVSPRDFVELRLKQIWEKALNIQPVGITHNFFQLGGHSLLAVRLMNETQKSFGISLPLAILFQRPTIEQLAELIRQDSRLTVDSSLVGIQRSGTKTPFFCVHPIGGNVLCYYDLAHQMGMDQPFYGLQSIGLYNQDSHDVSIEMMAARYVDEIRAVQPEGPYLLGGWSMGGIVAFEMAQQLRRHGQTVNLLALFDAPSPNQPANDQEDEATILRRLAESVANTFDLSLPSLLKQFAQLNGAREPVTESLPLGLDVAGITNLLRVFKANLQALRSYVAHPYDGEITIFPAEESNGSIHREWGELAVRGLHVHKLPGNHYSILKTPCVEALSIRIRACIEAVQTRPALLTLPGDLSQFQVAAALHEKS